MTLLLYFDRNEWCWKMNSRIESNSEHRKVDFFPVFHKNRRYLSNSFECLQVCQSRQSWWPVFRALAATTSLEDNWFESLREFGFAFTSRSSLSESAIKRTEEARWDELLLKYCEARYGEFESSNIWNHHPKPEFFLERLIPMAEWPPKQDSQRTFGIEPVPKFSIKSWFPIGRFHYSNGGGGLFQDFTTIGPGALRGCTERGVRMFSWNFFSMRSRADAESCVCCQLSQLKILWSWSPSEIDGPGQEYLSLAGMDLRVPSFSMQGRFGKPDESTFQLKFFNQSLVDLTLSRNPFQSKTGE